MIYFIQGTITKNIKIGFTDKEDIEDRMSGLSSSDPLICLRVLYDDAEEGKHVEKCLHNQFKHLSSHGEWFHPGPDLLAYIESIPKSKETGMVHKPKPIWERHNRSVDDGSDRPLKQVEGTIRFFPYTERDSPRWNAILIFKCPHCDCQHQNREKGEGEPNIFYTDCTAMRGRVGVVRYVKQSKKKIVSK